MPSAFLGNDESLTRRRWPLAFVVFRLINIITIYYPFQDCKNDLVFQSAIKSTSRFTRLASSVRISQLVEFHKLFFTTACWLSSPPMQTSIRLSTRAARWRVWKPSSTPWPWLSSFFFSFPSRPSKLVSPSWIVALLVYSTTVSMLTASSTTGEFP